MIAHITVSDKARPKGFRCTLCSKVLQPGDSAVYYENIIDGFGYDDTIERNATHTDCMQSILDKKPILLVDKFTKNALKKVELDEQNAIEFAQMKKEMVEGTFYARV